MRSNTEDFLKGRPEFVIVDTREEKSYFAGHDFDWIGFMKGDPAFAEAWRNYRLAATVPQFEIWQRRDD
ncbi:MAG: hypothetical protein H6891_13850 [Brucellaceae bacterium]|nr:hypothetical protein [Brucellaceae bacterium]